MWKNKKKERPRLKKGRAKKWLPLALLLCGLWLLNSCGQAAQQGETETSEPVEAEKQAETDQSLRIGLILTSRDDPENESVQAAFESLASDQAAELTVKTPDVSASEAAEARSLEYRTFVLCDVDPIEYQMLAVNELIAEGVEVIAIHANHTEALESVLSAARSVGVRVVAFEQPVTEESCDIYAETVEEAVREIKSE